MEPATVPRKRGKLLGEGRYDCRTFYKFLFSLINFFENCAASKFSIFHRYEIVNFDLRNYNKVKGRYDFVNLWE